MKMEFSLCSVLLVIFITLKLCHVIQWSWWWVLSPLWLPTAIFFVVVSVLGLIGMIGVVFSNARKF